MKWVWHDWYSDIISSYDMFNIHVNLYDGRGNVTELIYIVP